MYNICVVKIQQKTYFFLDTCFWRKSAIIIYLTYPINYHIIWAEMRELKIREHVTNVLSTKAFRNWVNKAKKGETISYYRGYIADPSIQRIGATSDVVRVENFRKEVYSAYLSNLVTLIQKKHDDLDYEYIAVKTC